MYKPMSGESAGMLIMLAVLILLALTDVVALMCRA